jgi:hypothetical protein
MGMVMVFRGRAVARATAPVAKATAGIAEPGRRSLPD